MSKYIIEIEDESIDGELYKAKGFNSLVFDQTGLNKLEKYEEPEKKEEKINRFKPILKKDYYLISEGGIKCSIWEGDNVDIDRYAIGNCFKTREEAEFELERLKVIAELKEFAEGDDAVWDGHNKHYILGFDTVELNINFNVYLKSGNLYFSSEEIAQKAIDTIGADRIKKYYLRVKE